MNSQQIIKRVQRITPEGGKQAPDRSGKATNHSKRQNAPSTATEQILHLQKTVGNQAAKSLTQAKLRVGPVGDAWEQQADRVAEQAVQAPEQGQTPVSRGKQRSPASSQSAQGGFLTGQKMEQQLEQLRGAGNPLPGELRREMEQKLGGDFGQVRLHTNQTAQQLNRSISARAFTHGQDIFLANGEYSSTSQEGKRLLAHELTHVVQQSGKKSAALRQTRAQTQTPDPVVGPSTPAAGRVIQREYHQYDDSSALDGPGDAPAEPEHVYDSLPELGGAGAAPAGPDHVYDSLPELGGAGAAPAGPEHVYDSLPELGGAGAAPAEPEHVYDSVPELGGAGAAPALAPAPAPAVKAARKYPKSQMAIDLTNGSKKAHPEALKLPEKFAGEQNKVGWRATYGKSPEQITAKDRANAERTSITTRHYSDADRESNELGKTGDHAKVLYAMSPEGRMVTQGHNADSVRQGGKRENFHHSTIFAGGDVAHAGHVGVQQGKVNYLDDDSGHYRPGAQNTWDAYNRMKAGGMLADKGKVSMVDKTQAKGLGQDASKTLSLPFSAYDQTHGNEEQARNKNSMLAELLKKTANKKRELDG